MISVFGMGWVGAGGHGCAALGKRDLGRPERAEVFIHPFKNFGRLDPVSKATCQAAGLALRDAGLAYPADFPGDAGIVGTNSAGCLGADKAYFKDYVESRRISGRGNLFIYTLPSSPLGEAAIHFGLVGPLLYVSGEGSLLSRALSTAADMIEGGEAALMLAGMAEEDSSIYMVLAGEAFSGREALCGFSEAEAMLDGDPGFEEMVNEFMKINNTRTRERAL